VSALSYLDDAHVTPRAFTIEWSLGHGIELPLRQGRTILAMRQIFA